MKWERGDWMQTYTGRAFYPLAPDPADVDPVDIAHALSMLCRYNGHVARFYSVAEHCLLVSGAVAAEHALWGLLHDATEAYLGDLIRPVKRSMPLYVEAETKVMAAICTRFGLPAETPDDVKDVDTRILQDERAALLSSSPQPWASSVERAEPLNIEIRAMGPHFAEKAYLRRLRTLTDGAS